MRWARPHPRAVFYAARSAVQRAAPAVNARREMNYWQMGDEYETALDNQDVAALARMATLNHATCGPAAERLVLVASAANQLHRAMRDGNVDEAIKSLVSALGETSSALGRTAVLIATVTSIPKQLTAANTTYELISVVNSALGALALDGAAAAVRSLPAGQPAARQALQRPLHEEVCVAACE